MGVVKLSQSLKQVQFVSDEGVVYVTSVKYLLGFLNSGGNNGSVLRLNVLPLRVSPGRFPKSVVWSPELREEFSEVDGVRDSNKDALSSSFKKKQGDRVGFRDEVVF